MTLDIRLDEATPYIRCTGADDHVTFDTREGLFHPRTVIEGSLPRFASRIPPLLNTVVTYNLGTVEAGSDFIIGYLFLSWPSGDLAPFATPPPLNSWVPMGGTFLPVFLATDSAGTVKAAAAYSVTLESGIVKVHEVLAIPNLFPPANYDGVRIFYRIRAGRFV